MAAPEAAVPMSVAGTEAQAAEFADARFADNDEPMEPMDTRG